MPRQRAMPRLKWRYRSKPVIVNFLSRSIFQEMVMNRSFVLAGLCAFSVWAMSGSAFAQSPIACSLISE